MIQSKRHASRLPGFSWDAGRVAVSVFISPYVVEEASAGDPQAAKERIEVLRIFLYCRMPSMIPVGRTPLTWRRTTTQGSLNALHIACASYHEIDVLLTWNCTHIAILEVAGSGVAC
ncbi:MAG: hypothetical protein U5J62_08885 [Desulfurivibrio sp.]|nr:hypothetical protein [Desulfurivibrio sp.]